MLKKSVCALMGGLMMTTLIAGTPAKKALCPKEAAVLKQVQEFFKFDTPKEPLEVRAMEIFANRLAVRQVKIAPGYAVQVRKNANCSEEEFRLSGRDDAKTLVLDYRTPKAFIYAIGKLLRDGVYADGTFTPGKWRGIFRPAKSLRCVYLASHFYNVYEVWTVDKMEKHIEDLALLGYNYVTLAGGSSGTQEAVDRRLHLMKYSNFLGMKNRSSASNFGSRNAPQEIRATPTGHSFLGTEICISNPKGMEYILERFKAKLEREKDFDIGIFQFWPYDQGGCGCKECYPYGVNGMFKLAEKVVPLVKKTWPNAKIVWSCWEFGHKAPQEWDMLYERINSGKADFIDYLMIDEHNNFPEYPLKHGLPGKTKMITFPEITMWGRHPWGGYGATPLPKRFAGLYGEVAHLSEGGVLYSEGIHEDFTKAMYAGFFNNGNNDFTESFREYANYELGLKPEMMDDFKRLVDLMEENHRGLIWAENGDGKVLRKLKNKPVWTKVGKVWKNTDEMLALAKKLDSQLPEWSKKSWRWRIFYLRAVIDYELSHNGDEPNENVEKALIELTKIYEVSPVKGNRRVTPFTDEWIRHHIDKNFKLNLELLGVD